MISYSLYISVTEELASCTRMQTLALAALGLERLWKMFSDWTDTEGDPLLYQRPAAFRRRARDILDLFWAQIEAGQESSRHDGELRRFLDFVNGSCDGNDAPDVDMGTGRPLLNEMFGGVQCFFSEMEEKSNAAGCVTAYAGYLEGILYDRYDGPCREGLPQVPPGERAELLERRIDAAIGEDPLWKAELARIRQDFLLVRDSSADFARLRKRRAELWQMDYLVP